MASYGRKTRMCILVHTHETAMTLTRSPDERYVCYRRRCRYNACVHILLGRNTVQRVYNRVCIYRFKVAVRVDRKLASPKWSPRVTRPESDSGSKVTISTNRRIVYTEFYTDG